MQNVALLGITRPAAIETSGGAAAEIPPTRAEIAAKKAVVTATITATTAAVIASLFVKKLAK